MRIFSQMAARAGRAGVLCLLVAACTVPAGAGSVAPVPSPIPTSSSSPTPAPRAGSITAADAAAIVLALDRRFAGLAARDPGMVGQGSWYEVTQDGSGWHVTIQVGSGDCPAGCIDRQTWEYAVGPDGTASMIGESRDAPAQSVAPSPAGGGLGVPPVPIPSSGGPWLVGVALAGPVCPVERLPPDPACSPRPVSGAMIVVLDPSGRTVATATTAADGTYLVAVPAGSVRIAPARVAGMMRPPAPVDAVVPAGPGAWLRVDLDYDTGIR